VLLRWLTEHRRKHLLEQPFPDPWRAYLEVNVAAYSLLDAAEQQRLRDLAQVFIAEKHWEGCGGLVLDDEMKVTIAGSACLMILGRDHDLFAKVVSILVYPSGVYMRQPLPLHRVLTAPISADTPVWGLSMRGGPVVLAWDSVQKGARDPHDGRNLVFHELAHKIDETDGVSDGTPLFESPAERHRWAAAFTEAFAAHKARAERGEPSLLRDYAITNEAEYFAVATEVYFEQPNEMRDALPDVYAAMLAFYRVDFATRTGGPPFRS
jgi:MtfA peptidase